MVIGNGQLSKIFQNIHILDNICIFASGVSNSNCVDSIQFEREKILLEKTLYESKNKKFVYFSSCALSAEEYPKNEYYKHKEKMEAIIKKYSDNYYIFRIPQLFGDLILHKTLVNFIYKSIEHNHKFMVYDEAYRYVIEISDVKKIVEAYLEYNNNCITVDIANNYRYKVLDIVNIFEKLLSKKANYELVQKKDSYTLDLSEIQSFIMKLGFELDFGEKYLEKKLKEKLI